jgi:Ca2+-binding RTX toxin-like protein
MSTLLGTDADETIIPGSISPTVTAVNGPLVVGADADLILAAGGNDTVNGGAGNDTLVLGSGDDTAIWNPGDGSDVVVGGLGTDTMAFNGSAGDEVMRVSPQSDGIVQLTRDLGNITMLLSGVENVVIEAGAGNDTLEAAGDLAALTRLTFDGGAGNDRIIGGNGSDLLLGGDGDDFVDGQQGSDVAFLGAGNDVFQWDPGDGSDVVEGQDGTDTMLFNSANVAENFALSANGGRALFTRNVGNIVMDLNDVERVDLLALGGADNLVVNDLAGTDIREVVVNLAEATAAADTVTLQGRAAGTEFTFANRGASLIATGVAAEVQVLNAGAEDLVIANGALDAGDEFRIEGDEGAQNFRLGAEGADLIVDGLAARIGIRGAALAADSVVINGGAGDDTFEATGNIAPLAHLVLDGGAGDDRMLGGNGADVLLGGDGNDFVDGQQGADTAFLGAGDDVFQWDPGDGSDVVEGQAGTDTMLFNGNAANEVFTIAANGQRESFRRDVGNIVMDIDGIERIEARAGAGNDIIDASALPAGRATLQLFGEDGDDRIIGSAGADFVNGGRGTDNATLGAGNDRFQWNPGEGNDVIDGGTGIDTHEFNGAAVAENFSLQASGVRALLTRNVGNIVMDQDNFERVELNTLGGADNVQIGDLRATDVREVLVDFAGVAGGTAGDGANDSATLAGGAQSEFMTLRTNGDDVSVAGLSANARLTNLDAGDAVTVDGNLGNDVINAGAADGAVASISLRGGAGNDTLIAGRGGMTLDGGAGNDLLLGGSGSDVLNAGTGRDILVGGDGDDLFSGEGDFTVLDFRAGNRSGDRLDLSAVAGIDDFGDVLAAAHVTRLGVVLDFGDDEITLLGVKMGQLQADDFLI